MLEILAKLVLSGSLGGIIGLEREQSNKPAGLRTNVLLAMGTTAFTMLSFMVPGAGFDPSRIAAQIISGIGFIGAGVIIRTKASVHGVTTAATIWTVTAIGMAVGFEKYSIAVSLTFLAYFVLTILKVADRKIRKRIKVVSFYITLGDRKELPVLQKIVEEVGGEIDDFRVKRKDKKYSIEMSVSIDEKEERELVSRIFELKSAEEIENA